MKNLKNITTAIIAVILFANTATAQTVSVSKDAPLTVKYLGSQEDYLIFQVEVNTAGGNFALLKINDKADGELYSQSCKSTSKTQTFKIEKRDSQELSFKLLSGKNVYTKTFSSNTSIIEKTTVNENDMVIL
jgi:hypothetical protein